jgi:hypothetical protein
MTKQELIRIISIKEEALESLSNAYLECGSKIMLEAIKETSKDLEELMGDYRRIEARERRENAKRTRGIVKVGNETE